MSLDVYLETPGVTRSTAERIFVRENGRTIAISRLEWDLRCPGRTPVVMEPRETEEVYHGNITGNLAPMAEAAGLYKALWQPETIGITRAAQLIRPLSEGLSRLRERHEHFQAYNPKNGWGSYQTLVIFVAEYLSACEAHPDAKVRVWI